MGKVKTFSVGFKNNRMVYAPGDLVEGHVNVGLKKQKKIKSTQLWNFNSSLGKVSRLNKINILKFAFLV